MKWLHRTAGSCLILPLSVLTGTKATATTTAAAFFHGLSTHRKVKPRNIPYTFVSRSSSVESDSFINSKEEEGSTTTDCNINKKPFSSVKAPAQDTATTDTSSQLRRDVLVGSAALASLASIVTQIEHKDISADLQSIFDTGTADASSLSPQSTSPQFPAALLKGDTIVRSLWLNRLAYPVLVVALEIGLFEALRNKSLSRQNLGKAVSPPLRGDGRVLESLIAVLSSLELLQVDANGSIIQLTPAARHVLLQDSPYYWGPQLLAADGMTSMLRRTVQKDGDNRKTDYASGHSLQQLESFISTMQAHGSVTAKATAIALSPWIGSQAEQPARRILDMAGGSGCFTKAFAEHYSATLESALLADIPSVVGMFRHSQHMQASMPFLPRNPKRMQVDQIIQSVPADLFDGPTWPTTCDCHVLANVLHDWGQTECLQILEASRKSLSSAAPKAKIDEGNSSETGRLVVIEQLLQDDLSGPLAAALSSVSMLLGDWRTGKQYSFSELRTMMQQAGFARVELGPKCGDFHTAVIAYTR